MAPLRDDDPRKWVYARHTAVKHTILSKYLSAWFKILGSWHGRLVFVDGFAGRGEYEGGELGSPLLALHAANDYLASRGDGSKEVALFFIEENASNYDRLESVLVGAAHQYPLPKFSLAPGSCADLLAQVLDDLDQRRATPAPSFFFLDPFGWTGIPCDLIRRILRYRRSEVFVTFMARDINRFLSNPNVHSTFDELFCGRQWQDLVALEGPERIVALQDLYRQQLSSAGARYTWSFRVSEDDRTTTLYYLIHATNSFKGLKVMKDIMHGESVGAVFEYVGPRQGAGEQLRLIDDTDDLVWDSLWQRFAGKTVTFQQILEDIYPSTPWVEKQCRAALHRREETGDIEVERVSSKRSGLKGLDRITFPSR